METNKSRIGFIPLVLILFALVTFVLMAMFVVSTNVGGKKANFAGKAYVINESCSVKVNSDGLGVTLRAVDNDWNGKSIEQTVIISKNKFGGVLVQNEYLINRQPPYWGPNDFEYDVFYTKCREDAQRLPLEVRKAFLGHYDLVIVK